MEDVKQKPTQKTHTPPSKRWRNWWLDLCDGDLDEPYPDCDVWPSKEVAEQKAIDEIRGDVQRHGAPTSQHLGAYAVNS